MYLCIQALHAVDADMGFQPTLLMPIIQYIMPSKNKQLKKLLHFYWEVCPKYDESGKLKQEMILVVYVLFFSSHARCIDTLIPSNAIRNDLVSHSHCPI